MKKVLSILFITTFLFADKPITGKCFIFNNKTIIKLPMFKGLTVILA